MTTPAQTALDDQIAQLSGLSTADRILGLYAAAIDQSRRRDTGSLAAVLVELMRAIDFDYGTVADGFYRVYEYCLRKAREGDFDSVALILQDLRDVWLDGGTDS